MQKHIEKIENIKSWTVTPTIHNLTIETLGNFNLFSGKNENGYNHFLTAIGRVPKGVREESDLLSKHHYSVLHAEIKNRFLWIKENNLQIFATTQRYDVIQAFAEVAKEFKDVEAYYYRLGRSAIPSDNNRSIVSMYTIDELIEATSKNREVR